MTSPNNSPFYDRKLKVLELFSGTRSIGKAFEAAGHEVYSCDRNPNFPNTNYIGDIINLTAEMVLESFGKPDVIWASPDCTTYSIAAISHHRTRSEDGILLPKSDSAKFADRLNAHVEKLIKELNPRFVFVENPRGGLRKTSFYKDLNRFTLTYCQYGDTRMKPTDIWTNHTNPQFKPMCKNGDPCHQSAPRGSKTGTQGLKGSVARSEIPSELCRHIVKICTLPFYDASIAIPPDRSVTPLPRVAQPMGANHPRNFGA